MGNCLIKDIVFTCKITFSLAKMVTQILLKNMENELVIRQEAVPFYPAFSKNLIT